MARYKKKPVIVDAVQFAEGMLRQDLIDFLGNSTFDIRGDYLYIITLEGAMRADLNDWIIKGVEGEFYPCKPDIFEATYELVDELAEALGEVCRG
jgi:hypothetical protein